MRTKVLLSLAAFAVSALAAYAQSNVYSVNIVGYVNKPIISGLQVVANPLTATNNALSTIIPTPPDFSQVLRWNGSDFDVATYFFGWDQDFVINPGEGVFINASGSFTNTFVGEIVPGSYTNNLPTGLSLKSSIVPIGGTADEIGLTAGVGDFDQVLKWNTGTGDYDVSTYFFGWDITPSLSVAEGAFINAGAPRQWVQTLNP
jgi:hypothetical protein